MNPAHLHPLAAAFAAVALTFTLSAADEQSVRFEKIVLTDQYLCDGISAGDFNRDGKKDVVAGPYWYEGPSFKTKHEFYPMVPQAVEEKPTDSMFSFVADFNGDGWSDILVVGRVMHHEGFWYENPGRADTGAVWKKHFVAPRIQGESPQFLDIDGDGKPELLSTWQKQFGWWAPNWAEPTKPWTFVPITEKFDHRELYHGEGVGDINGDGRTDLVLNEGWWEQPAEKGKRWIKHPFVLSTDRGGAQILVMDVNGDGKNDVITAKNSHGWGLSWFEQTKAADGVITFAERRIMGTRDEEKQFGVAFSQPHALTLADMNGDGLQDIVTGKRRWAHGPKGDVEPMGTPVNYWFELVRDQAAPGGARYVPHLIDDNSALGTQVEAVDLNGDGTPDVLTASKLGAFVFLNRRHSPKP
jgi:hypothetical protein